MKERDTQVQEALRVSNKMDIKRPPPRRIIIKMPIVKENLISSKRKAVNYLQGSSNKIVRLEGIGEKHSKS